MATNVDAKLLKQTKFPPEFSQKVDMKKPDIKVLQIQLTGFLDKDTPKFCKELWTLCLSAQSNPQGVPKELLEAKKLELIQEKKLNGAKSKNGYEKGILTTSGSESALSEDEAAEEVTEDIMTTKDARPEIRGPRLRDAVDHRTRSTTVGLHVAISPIPISLTTEMDDVTKVDAGHLRPDDLGDRCLVP
ncbi:MAG: hypothetical protein LQ338_004195 [Usnochroma carphineum]|nr:MAG: hypothetical protein LQ338_004195 [Usnochroma carphineum]